MAERRNGLGGPPWFAANEALAFVLEIVALVALGWWGASVGGGAVVDVLLGVGLPAVAAALWWAFAAPRARFRPPLPGVLAIKALVLLGSAGALYALGHSALAGVFAVIVVATTTVAEMTRARFGNS